MDYNWLFTMDMSSASCCTTSTRRVVIRASREEIPNPLLSNDND